MQQQFEAQNAVVQIKLLFKHSTLAIIIAAFILFFCVFHKTSQFSFLDKCKHMRFVLACLSEQKPMTLVTLWQFTDCKDVPFVSKPQYQERKK